MPEFQNNNLSKVVTGREYLHLLESQEKYVFHGSENPDLITLEPRQGFNYENGVQIPDGNPAVFASNKADYAILMALINKKNCPNGYSSSAGTTNNEAGEIILELSVRKDALEQLTENSSGFVYIFDRNDFLPRKNRGVEYTSEVPVTSIDKVKVTKKDFPPYVQIYIE